MLSMSSLSLSVRAYGILCRIERAGNVQLTQRTLSSLEDVESNIPSRPFRSVLYVPASNTRAMNKLASLHGRSRPDAVMFDLEDGVGPDNKNEARENLLSFFEQRRSDSSTSLTFNMVRVNKMNTPWFDEDAQIASELRKIGSCDTVVLPKIEGINDLEAASTRFAEHGSDTSFWPMIETPKAILSAGEIASHPKVHGLILGTNDLGKELQLRPTGSSSKSTFSIGSTSATSREGLITSIQTTIIAARAHGKVVIDGVYNNFRDADGFQYECINGKEWGMDGKSKMQHIHIP